MAIGGLYALVAIGYSLVFGILNFVNFAHGDIYMLGAYAVLILGTLGLPLVAALPLAALACALLGAGLYLLFYRPLASRARLTLLIAAVAVSLLLQNGAQLLFGAEAQAAVFALPDDIWVFETWGDLVVRVMDVWIVGVALLLALVTWLLVRCSRLGLAIRAVASNPRAAAMVGVPVARVVAFTFALSAALATVAGALQSMATNQVMPLMGLGAGLKAFVAAVLGGMGSLWGAVLGGFALGLLDGLLVGLGAARWKDVVAYGLLILLLLVRPQGLLGRARWVKV